MNDNTQNKLQNVPVGKTVPSRPHKLTVIGLLALVVGFFVIVLTHKDEELESKKPVQPPVVATQTK